MLQGLGHIMHFAGLQFSYLLNGSNPHKVGQGCGKGRRGGQVRRQPKCSPSVCWLTPSCQGCQFCLLSVSPDQEKEPVTPVNWFPGAQSSLSGQVNWGVEPPAGHLGEQSVDAYCVPELEGAPALLGGGGDHNIIMNDGCLLSAYCVPGWCFGFTCIASFRPQIPILHMEKLSPQLLATALSAGAGHKKECFLWLGVIIEVFPVVVTCQIWIDKDLGKRHSSCSQSPCLIELPTSLGASLFPKVPGRPRPRDLCSRAGQGCWGRQARQRRLCPMAARQVERAPPWGNEGIQGL